MTTHHHATGRTGPPTGHRRPRRVVRDRLTFTLLDPTSPPHGPGGGPLVRAYLRWTHTDPDVVELTFPGPVCWRVGRDLLTAGLAGDPVGLGDLSVLPDLHHPGYRELVLSTPHGHACLRFHTEDLAGFLTRTTGRDGGPQ